MLRALKTHPKALQWNFNYIICWWFGLPIVRYHKYSKWNKKDKNNIHVKLCEFENLNLFSTFSKKINHAFLSWLFMNFAPTYIFKNCPSHSQLLGPIFFHLHSEIIQLIFTKLPTPFQTFWASNKLFTCHFKKYLNFPTIFFGPIIEFLFDGHGLLVPSVKGPLGSIHVWPTHQLFYGK
jgi:hypothetical protein